MYLKQEKENYPTMNRKTVPEGWSEQQEGTVRNEMLNIR